MSRQSSDRQAVFAAPLLSFRQVEALLDSGNNAGLCIPAVVAIHLGYSDEVRSLLTLLPLLPQLIYLYVLPVYTGMHCCCLSGTRGWRHVDGAAVLVLNTCVMCSPVQDTLHTFCSVARRTATFTWATKACARLSARAPTNALWPSLSGKRGTRGSPGSGKA